MTASDSRFRSLMVGALVTTCYVYVMCAMLAVPYYNWQYARENGFVKWLVWGEIVPTGKALIWPYYALHSKPKPAEDSKPLSQQQINKMQIMTMLRALESAQQSSFISNTQQPGEALDQAQVGRMVEFDNQAILSANSTDEQTLDRIYPDLGTRFKGQFVESRKFFISGIRNRSREDLMKSKELDDLWATWYTSNRKGIEVAFNKAIP